MVSRYFNLVSLQLVFFSILFPFCANAQIQNQNPGSALPEVFPVSPKAFEFIKYTQIPVSKYTGVPSISIPIYTIKANGINIPITLDYHSNGFRVSEEAGLTGLGWSLNGLGSIVQVVKGYDDFSQWFQKAPDESQALVNASIAAGSSIPSSILTTGTNVSFLVQPNNENYSTGYNVLNYSEQPNMLDGSKDFDHDDFIFSVPGYSGEFYMDWNTNTFICLTDKNIQVTKNGTGFRIITPDGNIFEFNQIETTSTTAISRYGMGNTAPVSEVNSHLAGEASSRTYQLTDIHTKGGDEIDFSYTQTNTIENLPNIFQSRDYYTYQPPTSPKKPNSTMDVNGWLEATFPNNEMATTVTYSNQTCSYLSSITFPGGKLKFTTSNSRTDLIGAARLDTVTLLDNSNNSVKSFALNYDYFVGRTDGNNSDIYLSSQSPIYNTNKQPTELNTRLRLLSIQGSGEAPYKFSYDSEPLPKKTSLATDYWGYYNGQLNNVDFMPNIYSEGIFDGNDLTGINNNKNSNLTSTRAGVLNQVTYPTGGVSTFDYELNTFNNYPVTNNNSSTVSAVALGDSNNPTLDHTGQIFMSDMASVLYAGQLNLSTAGPNSASTGLYSAYIRLTILKKTTANLNLVNSANFWNTYNATKLDGSTPSLSSQVSDVIQDYMFFRLPFNSTTQSYATTAQLNNASIAIDPANIYIVQAYLDDSFGSTSPSSGASAYAYFSFLQNMNYNTSIGAGLRIKTIKTLDINSPPSIKCYSYGNGKLMSPLVYETKYAYDVSYQNGSYLSGGQIDYLYGEALVTKKSVNSGGFYAVSTNASGKYVGYDTVAESSSNIDVAGNIIWGSNGITKDLYTNQPDQIPIDPSFVPSPANPNATNPVGFLYPPQRSLEENGLVLTELIYNKNQNLLKETDNTYIQSSNNFYYDRLSCYAGQYLYDGSEGAYNITYNAVAYYATTRAKTHVVLTTNASYDGPAPLITTESFFYDAYDQLNKNSTTNSKGQILNTYFKHPYDFTSGDDIYGVTSAMLTDNIIDPVIETWGDNNGSKTFDTKIYYNSNTGPVWPVFQQAKIQTAYGSNALEDNLIYDQYGANTDPNKYKPLQYHVRAGGVNTSIFWGYNGQYPVAKIVGINYNTAKAYINQSVLDNPTDDNTLRTELNKIRTGLANAGSNAEVTSYTYAPLIGVTSETDPKGYTTYYNYDPAGRLSNVLDKNLSIIKNFSYNYTTPGTTTSVSVNATNGTSVSWNVVISNNNGSIVQSSVMPVGSSVPFSGIPSGIYNITITPVAGQSTSYAQLSLNGVNYSSSSFALYNININTTATLALSAPAAYGTNVPFTYTTGNSSIYTNFATNGTSASMILSFNSTKLFYPNAQALIGNVGAAGIPTSNRFVPFSYNSKNWLITITTSGQVYLTLVINAGPATTGTIAAGQTLYYSL